MKRALGGTGVLVGAILLVALAAVGRGTPPSELEEQLSTLRAALDEYVATIDSSSWDVGVVASAIGNDPPRALAFVREKGLTFHWGENGAADFDAA